ncbi:MAG: DUF4340 domain-containing protein [Oscillospiraceae bacterium]|nr:DUF4340 domain-containing protein [Oscillospiraceae bacterium]
MKKNIKLIIICAVVVAVLAGLLVFLMATKQDTPDEQTADTAEEEITTSLLYSNKLDDLDVLTIENEHGTYKVERVEINGQNLWTIMEIANLPLSNTVITTLVENAISVTAQQTVVENPEDISIYGLDKPLATVTAQFTDSANTVRKLYVGNKTPKGTAHYFMMEGDPAVYTVNVGEMSPYLNDKWTAVIMTVFSAASAASEEDTTDYSIIQKMVIDRADLDYDMVIEYDKRLEEENNMVANSSMYVLTSPVFRELNPETCDPVTNGVFGLTATELCIVNPVEEDMVNCGLAEPAVILNVEANGNNSMTLKIGNEYTTEDGAKARFVHVEGADIIYGFTTDLLPWLTVKPLDITTTMFTSNYIYDLTSVDIATDSEKYDFEITGSSADDFAVTLNGQAADGDAFKNFYQFILRAPSTDVYFEETTAKPVLTVDIKTTDGGDSIEFIPSDNRQSIIRLNGKVTYVCATAYVDRFISNLELFKNGEEIITNW